MNRNLFGKEMHKNLVSLILWMCAIAVLIIVTMSAFPAFLENRTKIMGMMSILPKGALQFKGISNPNDMLSVLGFYAVNNIIYMMVLGSIYSIVLSSNILLKEEYNKTAEYLLTKPISRQEIFFSKVSLVFTNVLALNLGMAIIGFMAMKAVQHQSFNAGSFSILCLYTFMLNLLFGAAGLFISGLVKKPRPITTLCIAMVLFFYFVFTLSKITEEYSAIGWASPFKFVDAEATHAGYHLEGLKVLYFLGITFVMTAISFRLYTRKDIYL
jgi:ABC-2 type transport system permease protein